MGTELLYAGECRKHAQGTGVEAILCSPVARSCREHGLSGSSMRLPTCLPLLSAPPPDTMSWWLRGDVLRYCCTRMAASLVCFWVLQSNHLEFTDMHDELEPVYTIPALAASTSLSLPSPGAGIAGLHS